VRRSARWRETTVEAEAQEGKHSAGESHLAASLKGKGVEVVTRVSIGELFPARAIMSSLRLRFA
jgi:hypothetical protein